MPDLIRFQILLDSLADWVNRSQAQATGYPIEDRRSPVPIENLIRDSKPPPKQRLSGIQRHCKGCQHYWNRKSKRGTSGRPPIDPDTIDLIQRMWQENVT